MFFSTNKKSTNNIVFASSTVIELPTPRTHVVSIAVVARVQKNKKHRRKGEARKQYCFVRWCMIKNMCTPSFVFVLCYVF